MHGDNGWVSTSPFFCAFTSEKGGGTQMQNNKYIFFESTYAHWEIETHLPISCDVVNNEIR